MQSPDTNEAAEKVLISLMQKASFSRKFACVASLSETVMQLSRRAIARANSGLSEEEVDLLFVEYHYGKDLAKNLKQYLDQRHESS